MTISCCVALLIGIARLPTATWGDDLSIYGTQLNALRVAKGFFWGIFFAPFVLSDLRARLSVDGTLLAGFRMAGTFVALCLVWEQLVTIGFLNPDDPYRASGPFFSSHIGGMQVDGYWAVMLPILLILPAHGKTPINWIGYAFAIMLAYLAIAATMSRGVVVVAIGQTIVAVCALLLNQLVNHRISTRRLFGGLAAGMLLGGLVVMFVASEAMWSRMATIRGDWQVRWSHWQQIHRAIDRDAAHYLFGNGTGVVPNYVADAKGLPEHPAELVRKTNDQPTLHITPGRAVYIEQLVDARAPGPWQLRIRAHGATNSYVTYHLCRKTLYRSFECVESSLLPLPAGTPANMADVSIDVHALQQRTSNLFAPPITFAISAGGDSAGIEVDSVQLTDASEHNLLKNGDFKDGSHYWFFTSDDLSAWRADNLWVNLFVEQGLLGVAAFGWLLWKTLSSLVKRSISSIELVPVSLTSSILGFLAIGMIGSLVDTPNLTSLLLLCIAISQAECSRPDTSDGSED